MLRGVPRVATRTLQSRGLHFSVGGRAEVTKSDNISRQYPGKPCRVFYTSCYSTQSLHDCYLKYIRDQYTKRERICPSALHIL